MLRLSRLPSRLSPPFASVQRRSLASSGLLTRAWQNDTIADLRSEAKLRGLSAKGSKLALASRIEEYERNLILQSKASGSRHASSAQPSTSTPTEVPGNPELPPVSAAEIFNIKLPELSQVVVAQDQIQIPYLPDYWNSSSPAASSTKILQEEPLPKILVVAGVETHPGGGPSHNLLDLEHIDTPQNAPEPIKPLTETKRTESVFDDIAEDLGLPPVKDLKTSLWKLF